MAVSPAHASTSTSTQAEPTTATPDRTHARSCGAAGRDASTATSAHSSGVVAAWVKPTVNATAPAASPAAAPHEQRAAVAGELRPGEPRRADQQDDQRHRETQENHAARDARLQQGRVRRVGRVRRAELGAPAVRGRRSEGVEEPARTHTGEQVAAEQAHRVRPEQGAALDGPGGQRVRAEHT